MLQEQLANHMQKYKFGKKKKSLDANFASDTKINSKWIMELNTQR